MGKDRRLTFARLSDRLVAGHALASAGRKSPVAVAFAQESRRFHDYGVRDTLSLGRNDGRQLSTGRRLGKEGELADDAGTDDVIDSDGDQ